ncbi:hypothetical protein F4778DRAFT_745497 [Xylariomycetidae sp. FL2044]|nr:hypothetical protein F4778DRAFT_745497 [Xylariomycetidae sp. FL2044]
MRSSTVITLALALVGTKAADILVVVSVFDGSIFYFFDVDPNVQCAGKEKGTTICGSLFYTLEYMDQVFTCTGGEEWVFTSQCELGKTCSNDSGVCV